MRSAWTVLMLVIVVFWRGRQVPTTVSIGSTWRPVWVRMIMWRRWRPFMLIWMVGTFWD